MEVRVYVCQINFILLSCLDSQSICKCSEKYNENLVYALIMLLYLILLTFHD